MPPQGTEAPCPPHERIAALEAALAQARLAQRQAEQACADKARLLAHLGHEIGTPLAGVLGLAGQAMGGTRDPGLRRLLGQVQACGHTLRQLADELLQLAELDAGLPRLQPRPTDLCQLLAEAMRLLAPQARARGLATLFDIQGETDAEGALWVQVDANALRQILTNLLGNAIKYTAHGHVALTAHACALPAAPGAEADAGATLALTIQVADTGPGIAAEQQTAMFRPFVRGHGRVPERAVGTEDPAPAGHGLGLAIAQGLAQAMGGAITVHCPPEGGSVFGLTLSLPRATPAPRRRSRSRPVPAGAVAWLVHPAGAGDGARWLARRLQREGWNCRPIDSLAQAVQAAKAAEAARSARTTPGAPSAPSADAAGSAGSQAATAAPPGQPPHTDPAPQLVLLTQAALPQTDCPATARALGALRRACPQAVLRLVIDPDWHLPRLEARARRLRALPLLAPLTPAALRELAPAAPRPAPARPAPGAGRGRATLAEPFRIDGLLLHTAAHHLGPDAPPGLVPRRMPEVLLVEDNPVNELVTREHLRALGLAVRVARDGAQALAACQGLPAPALVLMDLQLPDMSGLQVTQALRHLQHDGRWPGAPIVALTAHADTDARRACARAGMDGVLTKPLTLRGLRQRLARWLTVEPV